MTIKNPHIGRNRGAQYGNKNTLKHGFYAIKPEVLYRLSNELKGEGFDEIDLLRSVLDTTASVFFALDNPTLEQCNTTLRGTSHAIDSMKGVYIMQRLIFNNQTTIEKALEELKDIPPEED